MKTPREIVVLHCKINHRKDAFNSQKISLVLVLQYYHSKTREVLCTHTHTHFTERTILSRGKNNSRKNWCLFKDIRDKEFSVILNSSHIHHSVGDCQTDHYSYQGSPLAP